MNIPNIDINGKLRQFNIWWDSFILEIIKPMAILSMGLGTVAIFNLQGLAIHSWFVTSWAIVQAMSIDGLFFATWDRLFSIQPSKEKWLPIVGLSLIGIALAIVAIAINAILGFQVLWAIGNSQEAMARLGVSSELFTIVRAILAVTVFVMVSFVRSRARVITEPTEAIITKGKHSPQKAIVVEEPTQQKAIPEKVTLGMIEQRMYEAIMGNPQEAVELLKLSQEQNIDDFTAMLQQKYSQYATYITPSRVANVLAYARSHSPQKAMVDSPLIDDSHSHKDKIKATWLRYEQEGKAINMKAIALDAGVGYSTVKKWASEIKQEIESEV